MKVEDILQLNAELGAFLAEPINLGLKYKLTVFLKQLNSHIEPTMKMREELIRKHADGGNEIKAKLEDGKDNPKIKEFLDDYKEVTGVLVNLTECPEIEDTIINSIVSKNNYPKIYEYLLKETKKVA